MDVAKTDGKYLPGNVITTTKKTTPPSVWVKTIFFDPTNCARAAYNYRY